MAVGFLIFTITWRGATMRNTQESPTLEAFGGFVFHGSRLRRTYLWASVSLS